MQRALGQRIGLKYSQIHSWRHRVCVPKPAAAMVAIDEFMRTGRRPNHV
jgi:hypothetical protein